MDRFVAYLKRIVRKRIYWLALSAAAAAVYYFALPDALFNAPYSTVLQSRSGVLLSASIAKDGQWRFPYSDSVPAKFADALVTFEDKRFWSHPGVDILSLGRALRQNIGSRRIVSGGSTITMQLIRLSRGKRSRTIAEKSIELVLATRLEVRYTKQQILSLYASHAPFGGNVVGLEAACWRYFGTDSRDLSWSQAALLAVLPNSPSLIHPGKNRDRLKAKRDRLLDKLQQAGKLDEISCSLAKAEPLPDAPHPLPRFGRHLLTRIAKESASGKTVTSTLDFYLQHRVEQILNDHHQRLRNNQIYNGAVLVLDVKTGNVLAYAGNITGNDAPESEVDVVTAPRSTGSILKPFLYAAMLDEGKILPRTLLPDIPVLINGFAPKNFSHEYDGVVHADKALIRSLNIPAVHMLKDFRYEKFHTLLTNLGMSTLKRSSDHYGLSLILGGAEGTLWEVTGIYASMARSLNNYFEHPGMNRYNRGDFHLPRYVLTAGSNDLLEETSWLSAASIYLTFETLKEVYRPGEESGWQYFNSSKNIAWKTGTSFGFRDGWAVGVTPDFAVGVWVGNADGEGRPGLTGTEAAAPVMFDVFSLLPGNRWFHPPSPEMVRIPTCRKSGHRASSYCDALDTIWIPKSGLITAPCPYHKTVHLTKDHRHQAHGGCVDIRQIRNVNWFVLPPVLEYYHKAKNISYKSLPPYRKGCEIEITATSMDMVYPKGNSRIFIPKELDGQPGSSVFEAAHRNPAATVYWHLDGEYIGSTKKTHHLALNPAEGKHTLTLIDENGETLQRRFEVISKNVIN